MPPLCIPRCDNEIVSLCCVVIRKMLLTSFCEISWETEWCDRLSKYFFLSPPITYFKHSMECSTKSLAWFSESVLIQTGPTAARHAIVPPSRSPSTPNLSTSKLLAWVYGCSTHKRPHFGVRLISSYVQVKTQCQQKPVEQSLMTSDHQNDLKMCARTSARMTHCIARTLRVLYSRACLRIFCFSARARLGGVGCLVGDRGSYQFRTVTWRPSSQPSFLLLVVFPSKINDNQGPRAPGSIVWAQG